MKFRQLAEFVSKKHIEPHVKRLLVEVVASDENDEDVDVRWVDIVPGFFFDICFSCRSLSSGSEGGKLDYYMYCYGQGPSMYRFVSCRFLQISSFSSQCLALSHRDAGDRGRIATRESSLLLDPLRSILSSAPMRRSLLAQELAYHIIGFLHDFPED